MRFALTDLQSSWRDKAASLASDLAPEAAAGDAVMGAVRVGLVDPCADLLSHAAAAEALAYGSPSAAFAYAMHVTAEWALRGQPSIGDRLARGDAIGALSLTADEAPVEAGARLSGRAAWIAPATVTGFAVLGARAESGEVAAFAVRLDERGVTPHPVQAAGLRGLACAWLELVDAPAVRVGPTTPVMARARVLIAAVGLGVGRRALAEALAAARAASAGEGGEQTVQGLLADAATELDAATLLVWRAASHDGGITLGDASTAKLTATAAAQAAVSRATQVIGADTFRDDHVVVRLAQDVRALELFAGRTEALRDAVAAEILPAYGATL